MVTATAAFAVNVSVENISGFKFWATLSLLGHGHTMLSFLVYVAINTVLVFAAAAVTAYVGPAAAGSGIAEVKVSVVLHQCKHYGQQMIDAYSAHVLKALHLLSAHILEMVGREVSSA